jgi:hypothetical protein
MSTVLTLPVLKCKICGHEWHPRREKLPKKCASPKCKSPNWNRDASDFRRTSKKRASVRPKVESATSTLAVGG